MSVAPGGGLYVLYLYECLALQLPISCSCQFYSIGGAQISPLNGGSFRVRH